MEALTACAVAALTIYDMCKSIDRGMTIGELALWEKTGGRSGTYRRPGADLDDSRPLSAPEPSGLDDAGPAAMRSRLDARSRLR